VKRVKEYLGDAVYADCDGIYLELTTENGLGATNRIFMEPEVIDAFIAFVTRMREEIKKEDQPHAND